MVFHVVGKEFDTLKHAAAHALEILEQNKKGTSSFFSLGKNKNVEALEVPILLPEEGVVRVSGNVSLKPGMVLLGNPSCILELQSGACIRIQGRKNDQIMEPRLDSVRFATRATKKQKKKVSHSGTSVK